MPPMWSIVAAQFSDKLREYKNQINKHLTQLQRRLELSVRFAFMTPYKFKKEMTQVMQ